MKPGKGNGVVILDQKLSNNTIKEIISDTSQFEKLNEDPTLKHEACNLCNAMKLNVISWILLVLFLLVSMVLLKCTNSPLVIDFLNFVWLFRLEVLLIITLPVSYVTFFNLYFLMITLAKILFLLFLKLRMQIFPKNSCFLWCD